MRMQPIPVVPAAHYSCGGVVTDEHGRTSVREPLRHRRGGDDRPARRLPPGLELAARGRWCSAARAADDVRGRRESLRPARGRARGTPASRWLVDEAVVVTQNWDEIRRLMWNYVGIVRTDKRLERARRRIELIREEIREYYWNFKVTGDLIELRNIALVAHLIIECARRRKESRGLHYTLDYPDKDERYAHDTVLRRGDGPVV